MTEPDGVERLEIVESAIGSFRSSFEPNLQALMVTDMTGTYPDVFAEVDLRPAIRTFCEENPADPDCEEADLSVLRVEVDPFDPLTLLGASFPIGVRTTFVNFGPADSIDAILTKTAAPGPGLGVTPTAVQQDELDLLIGEERSDVQSYQVSCDSPGASNIDFTSSLALKTVAAVDLFSDNDQITTSLDLDCIVPVMVSIKPGGARNPINFQSKQVPVAVLTTTAGENGNPAAFDAAAIEWASVRFGLRDVLASGGGSPERHGRLHLEDVVDLDGRTRDGDVDAVMHFSLKDSGLTSSSTEACVYGAFALPTGGLARFIGCDSIRIVPPR